MIEIIGAILYQWDIGRQVKVTPKQGYDIQKLNFTTQDMTDAKVVEDIIDHDGYITAEIPDEFFQQYKNIICYAIMINSNGEQTVEEKSFSVIKRNRPEDYDINSNKKIKTMLEEILGESGGDTVFDKLEYLKGCVDIMHESVPIRLMREVFKENVSFKELCEYIARFSNDSYENNVMPNIRYSFTEISAGYEEYTKKVICPNGEQIYINSGYYIANETYLYPKANSKYPILITPLNTNLTSPITFIDFRKLKFMDEKYLENKDSTNFSFMSYGGGIEALYLPKRSKLDRYCVYINDKSINNSYYPYHIKYGLHLGQRVCYCNSDWLFTGKLLVASDSIPETPVYCDKDFYGDIYLEKLNIPLECIVDLIDNLAFIDETMTQKTFSIGNYNLNKAHDYIINSNILDSEEFNKLLEDTENGVISLNEFIEKLKNLDRTVGIFYELQLMKGWNIQ